MNRAGGMVKAKVLRWVCVWRVERAARKGVWLRKEGSCGEATGSAGTSRSGQRPLGLCCHCPHLKPERLRLRADEIELGFRPRRARDQIAHGLAVWPQPTSFLSHEDDAGGTVGGPGCQRKHEVARQAGGS